MPDVDPIPDPLVGRIIDGRYRILSLLETGGMGRVYKAEQSSLRRIVVLKVLSVSETAGVQDPHFRERFSLEAATTSHLSHPNTITVFDYGRTPDGIYYIVMEYIEGVTLTQVLKTEKRLTPARALTIAGQVCQSLSEAHSAGIIHRDIKPANILLRHQGEDWVKVLDFGIAKVMSPEDVDSELTQLGTYVGTPEYMAPEAFSGSTDARSDIYSLGVVLHRMLTGGVPFEGRTGVDTAIKVIHEPVPPFAEALELPEVVTRLVLRCLEKAPEARFQTVNEVHHAITDALHTLGVSSTGLSSAALIDSELDLRLLLEEDETDDKRSGDADVSREEIMGAGHPGGSPFIHAKGASKNRSRHKGILFGILFGSLGFAALAVVGYFLLYPAPTPEALKQDPQRQTPPTVVPLHNPVDENPVDIRLGAAGVETAGSGAVGEGATDSGVAGMAVGDANTEQAALDTGSQPRTFDDSSARSPDLGKENVSALQSPPVSKTAARKPVPRKSPHTPPIQVKDDRDAGLTPGVSAAQKPSARRDPAPPQNNSETAQPRADVTSRDAAPAEPASATPVPLNIEVPEGYKPSPY